MTLAVYGGKCYRLWLKEVRAVRLVARNEERGCDEPMLHEPNALVEYDTYSIRRTSVTGHSDGLKLCVEAIKYLS